MTEVSKMSVKDWLVIYIITSIPLVGLVMLLIWAFGNNTNETTKTWAQAFLIWSVIGFGLIMLFSGVILAFIAEFSQRVLYPY